MIPDGGDIVAADETQVDEPPPVLDSFENEVKRAIEEAKHILKIDLKAEQAERFLQAVLRIHEEEVAAVRARALEQLPQKAPKLFSEHFSDMRKKYRDEFREKNGRTPFPNNDREDYTPVKFLNEIYGPFVKAGVITGKYLEDVDPPLYRALVDFVRGSKAGRAGRRPTTMEAIGVSSHRELMRKQTANKRRA